MARWGTSVTHLGRSCKLPLRKDMFCLSCLWWENTVWGGQAGRGLCWDWLGGACMVGSRRARPGSPWGPSQSLHDTEGKEETAGVAGPAALCPGSSGPAGEVLGSAAEIPDPTSITWSPQHGCCCRKAMLSSTGVPATETAGPQEPLTLPNWVLSNWGWGAR